MPDFDFNWWMEHIETLPEFRGFPKTTRVFSPVTVTEKVDGTNGVILVTSDGLVLAGSKNRWLIPDPENKGWDNHGFGRWVYENEEYLRDALGYGYHYGEWMGQGIARNYGLKYKQFRLFDVARYSKVWGDPEFGLKAHEPLDLTLVPVLYEGEFHGELISHTCSQLNVFGSKINNFDRPEGFIIRWNHNGHILKVVLDK